MKPQLILIRGVPGSGKTTYAEYLMKLWGGDNKHLETDMWFTKNGVYKFDPAHLKVAHSWCLGMTEAYMSYPVDRVFVSNTFTKLWEMEKYLKWNPLVYRMMGPIRENVHGVPESKVKQMQERFENYPYEYEVWT